MEMQSLTNALDQSYKNMATTPGSRQFECSTGLLLNVQGSMEGKINASLNPPFSKNRMRYARTTIQKNQDVKIIERGLHSQNRCSSDAFCQTDIMTPAQEESQQLTTPSVVPMTVKNQLLTPLAPQAQSFKFGIQGVNKFKDQMPDRARK